MAHTIVEEFKKSLGHIEESFKREAGALRSNRPSATLFDNLKVMYYDQPTPFKQLGMVSVVPPREIVVQVWDQGAVQSVAKAIEGSGLGFSPNVEGNTIRIFLPELSHERREELVKYARSVGEKHRIQIRQAREDANKHVQKEFDGDAITEDARFGLREEIQKETDKANMAIEKSLEAKIKEILE